MPFAFEAETPSNLELLSMNITKRFLAPIHLALDFAKDEQPFKRRLDDR